MEAGPGLRGAIRRFTALRLAPVLLLLPALASAQPRGPVLAVEAPPSLSGAAARLNEMSPDVFASSLRMTGLRDPGPPIRIVLMEESNPMARNVPPWYTGFTDGETGTVVLFPSRAPAYPTDGLDELVRHEVAHVLVFRAAGRTPVPRWFNEGLALFAGRPWGLEDRTRFATEVLTGGRVSLPELERLFAGGRADVTRAYTVSGAFLQEILERYGADSPGRILWRVSSGDSFARAFTEVTGHTPDEEADAFWKHQRSLERWLPFLTSTVVLWAGVTVLAIWAMRKRRKREADARQALADREAEEARQREEALRPGSATHDLDRLVDDTDDDRYVN